MQFAGKKGFWTLIILGVGLLCFVGWRYIDSFSTVTFSFNPTHGNVRLTSTTHGDVTVTNNQPLRLKKGEYTLSKYGEKVATESEVLHVDGTWQTRPIGFSYTREHLASLYEDEKPAIELAISDQYPTLNSLYTIQGSALYGRGNYYGAALEFNDRASLERDRLHILLEKNQGKWQVRSTPPVPILSVQDYPTVPRDILVAINQVK